LRCFGLIKSRATAIILSTILVLVGENCRHKDLSCDHHNSIGLKSGEYGNKHNVEASTASIIGLIESTLGAGKLSITTTAHDHNCGTKNFSINTSNAWLSIELSMVINATTRLRLIAPITVTFLPR